MQSGAAFRITAGSVLILCCCASPASLQTRAQESCRFKSVLTVLDYSKLPIPDAWVQVSASNIKADAAKELPSRRATLSEALPPQEALDRYLAGHGSHPQACSNALFALQIDASMR